MRIVYYYTGKNALTRPNQYIHITVIFILYIIRMNVLLNFDFFVNHNTDFLETHGLIVQKLALIENNSEIADLIINRYDLYYEIQHKITASVK